ncbi:unnamed protein product [Blepharisma stoltei]|uniref:Uncharacterized protein n=1 Tax=Blepharisma stoltei TaxID=1481888 RepID=A0AAU9IS53_9CILI|nr:unnamed protein product [Blepharisma stoltei]
MDIDYESEGQETSCSSYMYQAKEENIFSFQSKAFKNINPVTEMGIGYRQYTFLLKISKRGLHATSYQLHDFFKAMCEICDLLKLSDIEIVLWAIYLERFGWQEFLQNSEDSLLFAAYAAKCMLNENTIEFLERLQQRSESFSKEYKEWIGAHQNNINIDFLEMNSVFNELNYLEIEIQEEEKVDYNDVVDDLIDNTLESQRKRLGSEDSYTEKKRKNKL